MEKHHVWQLFLRKTETKTNRKQAGEKGQKAESQIQRRKGTAEALCVKKKKKRGRGDVVHREGRARTRKTGEERWLSNRSTSKDPETKTGRI